MLFHSPVASVVCWHGVLRDMYVPRVLCFCLVEGSEAATTGGKGERSGVHWGLITSGVSGAVLLLGLVAVVGLATYAYRQRQRNRHRW